MNAKSNAAGQATATGLPGSSSHQRPNSGIATAGVHFPRLTSAQASGWVSHQAIVPGSWLASGRGSSVKYQSSSSLPSWANATAPSASMEFSPGAGPSVSISTETNTSGRATCIALLIVLVIAAEQLDAQRV